MDPGLQDLLGRRRRDRLREALAIEQQGVARGVAHAAQRIGGEHDMEAEIDGITVASTQTSVSPPLRINVPAPCVLSDGASLG